MTSVEHQAPPPTMAVNAMPGGPDAVAEGRAMSQDPQEMGQQPPSHDKSCRVYVGNLAWKVQWQDLKDHMRSLGGNVVRADVFVDNQGRSRGCGIVEYETPEEAQHAIMQLTDTELFDRKIFVREDREEDPDFRSRRPAAMRAGPGAGRGRGGMGGGPAPGSFAPRHPAADVSGGLCQVFVGNLAWKTTWQDLKDLFRSCGDVVRAEVYSQNGRSRGCGTVLFKTQAEAQTAVEKLNDFELDGRQILVRLDEGPPAHRNKQY